MMLVIIYTLSSHFDWDVRMIRSPTFGIVPSSWNVFIVSPVCGLPTPYGVGRVDALLLCENLHQVVLRGRTIGQLSSVDTVGIVLN